jgi:predicted enzyme related to lactoylglutathione lyase
MTSPANPLVHLELHTARLDGARACLAQLCGWPQQEVRLPKGSYLALQLGGELGGGIVQCAVRRPLWLPYVQVAHVGEATEGALCAGAQVLLAPREGPAGWRSVVYSPDAGELGFWQPKRRC